MIFTPDSRRLVVCSRNRLAVHNVMHPFDIVAETHLALEGRQLWVWSPDGALCALIGWPLGVQHDHDFHLSIHRTETTETMYNHTVSSGDMSRTPCDRENGFAFSQDSRRLLFAHSCTRTDQDSEESKSICWIWDMYSTASPRKLLKYGDPVEHTAFNPVDSAQVFMTLRSGIIQIRDVASGVVLTNLAGGHDFEPHESLPLYSPDGVHIATTTGSEARLCNTKTLAVLVPIKYAHEDRFAWKSFSPDGTRILSSSSNAPAQLWDPHTARPILSLEAHINPIEAASFSPNSRLLALGYEDGTVRLWDVSDGKCLAVFTEHTARVTHLVFSVGGDILCSAGEDGGVYIRRLCDILPHSRRSKSAPSASE
ncbi:WD40 repeat-like protein [Lentinus tigrinus ALCF2SS1-7]|uniref:WD40 repeat-like protein n=1 Tax=Lentinus tigrinus ALCF2SS1-7 TaxID=1328758 RepID=UPI001166327C|nr:WD40 repeat-like protein [Lentinus tigrinus ALCF2SS1-7]